MSQSSLLFPQILVFCLAFFVVYASPSCITVKPSITDPLIDAWDEAHVACPPNTTVQRNQVFLFLPGTNGHPTSNDFLLWAQTLGFHVIGLNYANNGIVYSKCQNSTDPDCEWKLRNETLFGINYSKHVNVSHSNSIVNRINKLLVYLSNTYPTQEWKQFTDQSFSKIVATGSSQGSGYALFMGKMFLLPRVVMFNGPEDFTIDSSPLGFKSASWISAPSATPIDRIFGFNSVKDKLCQLSENNYVTIQLPGNWYSVDNSRTPYSTSHRLCTAQCPSHGCVIRNDYSNLFKPVWTYLLTYSESRLYPVQLQQNENTTSPIESFPSGPCECSGPSSH